MFSGLASDLELSSKYEMMMSLFMRTRNGLDRRKLPVQQEEERVKCDE